MEEKEAILVAEDLAFGLGNSGKLQRKHEIFEVGVFSG